MVETYNYYLLLGGNLQNTLAAFKQSIDELSEVGTVKLISEVIKSEPWGYESVNEYKNQALLFVTGLPPVKLLEKTQLIEKIIGRIKQQQTTYEDRVIDIDILFCDEIILESENLTIPHPMLHLREFALQPLCEIASSYIHPKLNKTIAQILKDLG